MAVETKMAAMSLDIKGSLSRDADVVSKNVIQPLFVFLKSQYIEIKYVTNADA